MTGGALAGASPFARAQGNLGELGLCEMAVALPDYVRMVADGERGFCEALSEMTELEVAAKARREAARKVRAAGFPYEKSVADFDFAFQPSVPRGAVEELATLGFMDRAENVVLVGSPGVGKTHIAVAIGMEAVRARRDVRFMDCAALVADLERHADNGDLDKRLRYYAKTSLLIVDELGYLSVGDRGADLLFQLVSRRYERRSTIITSNVPPSGWAGVFGNPVTASAIADRVCHHCTLIKITGRSYRLKDLPADKRRRES